MTSTTTLLNAAMRRQFLMSVWPWRGVAYTASTAVASGLLWLLLAAPLAPLALAVWLLEARRTGPAEAASGQVVGTSLFAAAALGLIGGGLSGFPGPGPPSR